MIGDAGACACERTQKLGGRETFVEFYLRRRLPCVKCACATEPDPRSHGAELQSTFSLQRGRGVREPPAGGRFGLLQAVIEGDTAISAGVLDSSWEGTRPSSHLKA